MAQHHLHGTLLDGSQVVVAQLQRGKKRTTWMLTMHAGIGLLAAMLDRDTSDRCVRVRERVTS